MSGAATGSQVPPSPGAPATAPAAPRAARPGHVQPPAARPLRIALLGNPNTGKTTLFNRLCGLRHKTSNFPGTTLEARIGRLRLDGRPVAVGARSDCCGQDDASVSLSDDDTGAGGGGR